jgi:hypothetical protein
MAWLDEQCHAVRKIHRQGARFLPLTQAGLRIEPPSSHKVRLAVVIPWTNACPCHGINQRDWRQATESDKPRLSTFFKMWAATAGANADVADFLLIHEPALRAAVKTLRQTTPRNVRWIEIDNLAALYRRRLNVTIPVNVENLKDLKPTIGHVFRSLLAWYTHWAFGDLDVLYGSFRRFLVPELLDSADVLSFVATDEMAPGSWRTHLCVSEETIFAGQLTAFRNTERAAKLFMQVPNWKGILSDPTKRRLTFFDERKFAASALSSDARHVALVVSQLTDQFGALDGRRLLWHDGRLLLLGSGDSRRDPTGGIRLAGSDQHGHARAST